MLTTEKIDEMVETELSKYFKNNPYSLGDAVRCVIANQCTEDLLEYACTLKYWDEAYNEDVVAELAHRAGLNLDDYDNTDDIWGAIYDWLKAEEKDIWEWLVAKDSEGADD